MWEPGGQTGEAASQETPGLALKRRNWASNSFCLTALEVAGVGGETPTQGTLTRIYRGPSAAPASIPPSQLSKSCRVQGGPCGGSGEGRAAHRARAQSCSCSRAKGDTWGHRGMGGELTPKGAQ